ncbi:RhuM family protein [Sulfurospirillum barnesii]|uniref:BRO family protein n=1 Tax=Sulfurospirillum barnesii (strain ATCC 700032 / DSM 10660 / SES-3) TaxID=760154 RepID=I3Y023_SULBS|nr:RhuM family protein [Sulfurospirillum barnesii]AFL69547.1 BRO family protein [Sulfurospirillum barnesii SES-3]
MNQSNVVVYNDGEIELKVSVNEETLWLNAEDIAYIFNVKRPAIVKHIGNIYKDEELMENVTCSILEQVAKDGKVRKINFYNLDMIISLGYRVNSKKATKFRQWATSVLKNYIQNGYALNSHKITEQRLSSLEKDVEAIKSHIKNNTLEMKEGIFFNGQVFDAYALLSDLIKRAKVSITLIDNYIDESILTLFSKNKSVKFTVYTGNITKQLQLDIEKYNKQYGNLEVKTTQNFHDRFLICDESVYHFGASLKDLGKKVFAVNPMNIHAHELLKNI